MGDWGWGLGNWGLGIGPNPQTPIPNPQSPIPTKKIFQYFYFIIIIKYYLLSNPKLIFIQVEKNVLNKRAAKIRHKASQAKA